MNVAQSVRLRELLPFIQLYARQPVSILYGLLLSVATLVGALGLLGLSGGFLFACAAAGLNPIVAETFDIVLAPGAIRLFAILRSAGRYAERVVTHDATFALIARLRTALYDRLAALSIRQIASVHSADVLNRMVKDVDALENLYQRLFNPYFSALLLIAAVAVTASIAHPILAFAYAALAAMTLFVVPFLAYSVGRSTSAQLTQLHAQLRTCAIDTVETLEEAALEPGYFLQRKKLARKLDERRTSLALSLQRRISILRGGQILLAGSTGFSIVVLASALSLKVDGPWLVATALLAFGLLEAILPLPVVFLDLAGTASSAARIGAVISQLPQPHFSEVPAPSFDAEVQSNGCAIDVSRVSFAYTNETVLKDVSFSIQAGEHVALLGPSGCGKSTMAKLLTRIEDPTEGEIRLGGTPIQSFSETQLRSIVTGTEQSPWIFEGTIEDNLRLAKPDAATEEMEAALETVGLAQTVRQWPEGLRTRVEQGGESLSGGQRKRLALARTLVKTASIWILDEPTEGLEAQAATELVRSVTKRLQGKTVIWVTHRKEALDSFDRTIDFSKIEALKS